jgi:hypothetical protein
MRLVVPNSQRINRGGMVLSELVETCRNHDFTDIVILHEHRGEPGAESGVTPERDGGCVLSCCVLLNQLLLLGSENAGWVQS